MKAPLWWHLTLVAVLMGGMGAGCRKRRPAAAPAEAFAPAISSITDPQPAETSRPSPASSKQPAGQVDLAPVQQAIDRYWKERKHTPYTLEDLVRAGYLQSLPVPPAGKQIRYDNERATVSLVGR